LHQLSAVTVEPQAHYDPAGRPAQGQTPSRYSLHLQAEVLPSPPAIALAQRRVRRFILATNVLDATDFPASQLLTTYKDQQAPECGFWFLKDLLFFTSSVFLNTPSRVVVLAFIMGLALMGDTIPWFNANCDQHWPQLAKRFPTNSVNRWSNLHCDGSSCVFRQCIYCNGNSAHRFLT